MTPVRFHNYVISSFLPASAHASMAQPCKLEAAFAWTKAENDRLSCRTLHTDWLLHSMIAIRQQGGEESSFGRRSERMSFVKTSGTDGWSACCRAESGLHELRHAAGRRDEVRQMTDELLCERFLNKIFERFPPPTEVLNKV
ncbi:MAG: hypothetical protein J5814_00220 [Bacteroidaceae bacterium]|nr:hypothetical protein [Bacteroidaceae bacterium]